MKPILIAVFLLLLIPIASAQIGSITLLAVSEVGDHFEGSIATLHADIKPGHGRVFIETIPAAKVDTQLSTRFAQQSACKFTGVDCSNLDFFYQIESSSGIIGGPSASAAISGLTAALLLKENIREDIAMTGTISSGFLVGPIGHVLEKVEAAANNNISLALIPKGQAEYVDDQNRTFDVITVGRLKGTQVIEVENLAQVVSHLTGNEIEEFDLEITLPQEFTSRMKDVSTELCSNTLKKKEILLNIDNNTRVSKREENLIGRGVEIFNESLFLEDQYYAKASRCFSANVQFQTAIDYLYASTDSNKLILEIEQLESQLSQTPITTLSDLQTMMIVMERVREAKDNANSSQRADISYAQTRLESAISWTNFFGMPGPKYEINQITLANSCSKKIGEIEELRNYILLYVPKLANTQTRLNQIRDLYDQEDFSSCLYESALLRSDLQAIASSIGVMPDDFSELVDRKLNAASKAIALEIDNGIFPMAAYSYYELGRSVQNFSEQNALIYAEYALELSQFDLYFEKEANFNLRFNMNIIPVFLMFVAGFFLGLALGLSKRKNKKSKIGNLKLR